MPAGRAGTGSSGSPGCVDAAACWAPANAYRALDALRKSLGSGARTPPAASAPARAEAREPARARATAAKHGIPKRDVNYAMEVYADNLLSDVVYNVKRFDREIERQTEPWS